MVKKAVFAVVMARSPWSHYHRFRLAGLKCSWMSTSGTNYMIDWYYMIVLHAVLYFQESQPEIQQSVLLYGDGSLWTGRICSNDRPKLREDQWQNVPPSATWEHERNCEVVCS